MRDGRVGIAAFAPILLGHLLPLVHLLQRLVIEPVVGLAFLAVAVVIAVAVVVVVVVVIIVVIVALTLRGAVAVAVELAMTCRRLLRAAFARRVHVLLVAHHQHRRGEALLLMGHSLLHEPARGRLLLLEQLVEQVRREQAL